MGLLHVTVELPPLPLVKTGRSHESFLVETESIELLHVYAFQPRESMLLVRIVRSGPVASESEMLSRERARWGAGLRSLEILRIEEGGRAYVALLRKKNSGLVKAIVEDLGAGVMLTTPTVLRREGTTLSFVADEEGIRRVLAALDALKFPWRLSKRRSVRVGRATADAGLTPRQREVLSLAWNLGYFDIPAKVGLARLAELTRLSRNVVSLHLRRGIRRILRERF